MQYILKNPPPPPTVQAIQHTSWDATEAWVESVTSQQHAPGFEAVGDDDSVNVPTPTGVENAKLNDAFIVYNGATFTTQDATDFNNQYIVDPNAPAS